MITQAHTSAAHRNLKILCLIRLIPLLGMFLGLYFLLKQQNLQLHWLFIDSLLCSLCLSIGLTWWRSLQPAPISTFAFFTHLLIDIIVYGLLMFNTGGASNPFISYLLVPVTIAAITLPATFTWFTGFLSLSVYSLLLIWYIPVPILSPAHGGHGHPVASLLNPHLLGMWINFVVSAGLIAYFVNKMAHVIHRQQQALNEQNQQQLEDDQLLAVATLAASAAHELGTPLNSMKLIIDDWQHALPHELQGDARILNDQINRCQATLLKLSDTARSYSQKQASSMSAQQFFSELVEHWQVMRPDVILHLSINGDPNAIATVHPALNASLHNLFNNAADASPNNVAISINWSIDTATLSVEDAGQGFNPLNAAPFYSDKPTGMGLGLYLSRSILNRHGCSLEFEQSVAGGTKVKVLLPLKATLIETRQG